jgi:hypothetical protein
VSANTNTISEEIKALQRSVALLQASVTKLKEEVNNALGPLNDIRKSILATKSGCGEF